MLALNVIVNNFDEIKKTYSRLGENFDLDEILNLEEELKQLSNNLENLKSERNKLCTSLFCERINDRPISELYLKILDADEKVKNLQKETVKVTKIINQKLSKLRNIPDELVEKNLILAKNQDGLDIQEFVEKLNSKSNFEALSKATSFLSSLRRRIFSESELPLFSRVSDGFVLLDTDFNIDEDYKCLKAFLERNARKFVRLESKKTQRDSADELVAEFESGKAKLSLKREFYTRKFAIKYKNNGLDVTKFVNEIDIKLK